MYNYLDKNFELVESEISAACHRSGREISDVKLITVTKTYPVELLTAVLATGHKAVGENRPQEIVEKVPALDGSQEVHLIGQLQTNKVRKMVESVDWIHSVDREKLLNKIDSVAEELEKPIKILVQVNTSGESSKSGCTPEEAVVLCEKAASKKWAKFCGVMTIGPLHGDDKDVRDSFKQLKGIASSVSHLVEDGKIQISMGMSGDFPLAIEEGATMIRVGSRIVGNRSYS
jgi:pyridoxal phosphate enzyme (YggS family)